MNDLKRRLLELTFRISWSGKFDFYRGKVRPGILKRDVCGNHVDELPNSHHHYEKRRVGIVMENPLVNLFLFFRFPRFSRKPFHLTQVCAGSLILSIKRPCNK